MPQPEWILGMPKARALRELGHPGFDRIPDITINLIGSTAAPGGVSGLGVSVLAPAVANAIYAGTGKRLRSLPFDLAAA